MSSYPGLGFDPAAGDPDAVADLAREYTRAADALDQARAAADRGRDLASGWTGDAAAGFSARLREVDTAARVTGLRQAATVLSGWTTTLVAAKATAERLDRAATALRRQITTAEDTVDRWRDELDLTRSAHAAAEHATAETGLADLRDRLDAVLREARTLAADHEHAANAVADHLDSLRGNPIEVPMATRSIVDLLNRLSTTSAAMAGLVAGPAGAARPPSAITAFTTALRTPPPAPSTITVAERPR
ncbi:WXG100 family type VII secretion target [Actinokineospora globicatena]|uniref:WXG100 family type VII secretion target n=1 Tax=Actinokineospora globicatena TaxID=103729 RepID=A0A9W6V9Z1_9PSEU|nr:hypothetical protein [Actinokineospora globicatena]GLW92449.1 hypothetical protein Aglo03_32650 [Actinokineospora globicatena]